VGAGVGLAGEAHDGAVFAADLAPVGDLAGVDGGDLGEGEAVDGVVEVDDHGDGVAGDHELHRVHAAGLHGGDLFLLDGAGGVGDIDGAVGEGGDACAGAAAGDRDADLGSDRLVGLGPGEGEVDHGVGAFILEGNERG